MSTRSHVEWHVDHVNSAAGDIVFQGRLSREELADLRLDDFDLMVIKSPIESAADLFQTLEIIFRRMAEQASVGIPHGCPLE